MAYQSINYKVAEYLRYFKEMGINSFDLHQDILPFTENDDFLPIEEVASNHIPQQQISIKAEALQEYESKISSCSDCPLYQSRNQVIFGRGDARAKIMFVGGYPSEFDDMDARLYSREEGDLLNKMIKALKVTFSEIFITTAIKCHPPEGVKPTDAELTVCSKHLQEQIRIIEPQIIVTFGYLPFRSLMGQNPKVFTKRADWNNYQGTPIMPTHSLLDILHNPKVKKQVWSDMKAVMLKFSEQS